MTASSSLRTLALPCGKVRTSSGAVKGRDCKRGMAPILTCRRGRATGARPALDTLTLIPCPSSQVAAGTARNTPVRRRGPDRREDTRRPAERSEAPDLGERVSAIEQPLALMAALLGMIARRGQPKST